MKKITFRSQRFLHEIVKLNSGKRNMSWTFQIRVKNNVKGKKRTEGGCERPRGRKNTY